jgi:thiamine biosynthesis lipoprotein ApbE
VTVLADTAEAAEVLAKVVFLLGSEQGKALLSQLPEAAAVLVRSSGEVLVCGEVEVIHA